MIDEPQVREAIARGLCKADGTAQCAAICLSLFASQTRDGRCPHVMKVYDRRINFVIDELKALL